MKLKPKKKKSKPSKKSPEPMGTMDQLNDPEYLPKLREKHRKGGTLDNYCELLETQIGGLVTKLLSIDLTKLNNVSPDTDKAMDVAKSHINAAANELYQAQQFFRDNSHSEDQCPTCGNDTSPPF